MVNAILELRHIVEEGSATEIAAGIDAFRAKSVAGDLDAREREGEIEKAHFMLSVIAYLERIERGDGLQAVASMSDGEPSFYRQPFAFREMARDDDIGQLDIAEKGIFYDGSEKMFTIPWNKVLTVGVDRDTLVVHPTRGGNPHTFGLTHPRAAKLAHIVATAIFKRQQDAKPASSGRRVARTQAAQRLPTVDVGDKSGLCDFNIVGESNYQGRLRKVCEESGRTFTAIVMVEPTNAYDPNAVRVATEGGDTIGYLAREDTVRYKPLFDLLARHGHHGGCRARLIGGEGEKRSFGVMLSLREHDDLLIEMRDRFEPGAAVSGDVKAF
jgi:hypothetical protein